MHAKCTVYAGLLTALGLHLQWESCKHKTQRDVQHTFISLLEAADISGREGSSSVGVKDSVSVDSSRHLLWGFPRQLEQYAC